MLGRSLHSQRERCEGAGTQLFCSPAGLWALYSRALVTGVTSGCTAREYRPMGSPGVQLRAARQLAAAHMHACGQRLRTASGNKASAALGHAPHLYTNWACWVGESVLSVALLHQVPPCRVKQPPPTGRNMRGHVPHSGLLGTHTAQLLFSRQLSHPVKPCANGG